MQSDEAHVDITVILMTSKGEINGFYHSSCFVVWLCASSCLRVVIRMRFVLKTSKQSEVAASTDLMELRTRLPVQLLHSRQLSASSGRYKSRLDRVTTMTGQLRTGVGSLFPPLARHICLGFTLQSH